jgi:hypothetical protein
VAQPIVSAPAATVLASARCARARFLPIAILALVAFLALGDRAQALDLTGGPVESPPGGATCQSDIDTNGSGLTLHCTITNPGGFTDLYFGLANTAANGVAMDGTGPTGREIFRYSSSTANTIVYTGATTIDDIITGSTGTVNNRLVLTLTSGSGIVIDTGGRPANNGNGDIQKLFRIAGNAFSLRLEVFSNHLTIPGFMSSNDLFSSIHHPNTVQSITSVNTGFYYLACTP